MTKQELIAFEEDIAASFNNKEIKAPIHLDNGSESQMIGVFESLKIGPNDWCLSTWRSHYISLLKGVPPERVKADILIGKSISLCYPDYNIFSSAIVGGSVSIGLGVSLNLKRERKLGTAYIFIGDMGSELGTVHECLKYAQNHKLPFHLVVADNNKSVCTDTRKTWSTDKLTYELDNSGYVTYFKYSSKFPHAGAGSRISF